MGNAFMYLKQESQHPCTQPDTRMVTDLRTKWRRLPVAIVLNFQSTKSETSSSLKRLRHFVFCANLNCAIFCKQLQIGNNFSYKVKTLNLKASVLKVKNNYHLTLIITQKFNIIW